MNYGVAPFPPPAAHPVQASSAVVQGPAVIVPTGAMDREAAVQLLAEAVYANSLLPTSRTAAQDPRFQQIPYLRVLLDLMAHPNAMHLVITPLNQELNEALGQVEEEVLHRRSDPEPLLDRVEAGFAPRLKEALSDHEEP